MLYIGYALNMIMVYFISVFCIIYKNSAISWLYGVLISSFFSIFVARFAVPLVCAIVASFNIKRFLGK